MERIATITGIRQLLREKNIRILQVCLLGQCKAAVRKLDEGYLILIEESLSFECMVKELQHEMCHILLGHLDDDTKSKSRKEMEVRRRLNRNYKPESTLNINDRRD